MHGLARLTVTLALFASACEEAAGPVDVPGPNPEPTALILPGNPMPIPGTDWTIPNFDELLSTLVRSQPARTEVDGGVLEPHELIATVPVGGSVTERKTASLPDTPPKGDVLFSFDLTGSMMGELDNVKLNAINIMNAVAGVIPDVNFGLISYEDYPGEFKTAIANGQPCNYHETYGLPGAAGGGDKPYRLHQAITGFSADVATAIDAMILKYGWDGAESYSRAFFETYSDAGISRRPGAKRIVVNFGDNVPHDCDYDAIIGGTSDTGHDPGTDNTIGTDDDLHILDVLNGMAAADITLISIHSGSQNDLWNAYAGVTGGANFPIDGSGTFPLGTDPAGAIAGLIEAEVSRIDALSLQACDSAPFDAWLSSNPAAINEVTLPDDVEFDLTITVPDGTEPGEYQFDVCLVGDGAEFGRQHVSITVPPATECQACQGGVTELTLRNNGPSGEVVVKVKVQASMTEIFRGFVDSGSRFTLNGQKGDGTFGKEIEISVDGGPEVKIHTSCSNPIGPDLVVGDFEVVEAFSRDGYSVDGKICPVGDLEGCEAGKPQVLVFEYTAEVCLASNNDQDPNKSVCTDLAPLPNSDGVYIIVTNKQVLGDSGERVWFEGGVSPGGLFNVDATNAGETRLDADTWAHILSADMQVLLQEVQFHGSCSQPLAVGDQFGSLIVREFVPEPYWTLDLLLDPLE